MLYSHIQAKRLRLLLLYKQIKTEELLHVKPDEALRMGGFPSWCSHLYTDREETILLHGISLSQLYAGFLACKQKVSIDKVLAKAAADYSFFNPNYLSKSEGDLSSSLRPSEQLDGLEHLYVWLRNNNFPSPRTDDPVPYATGSQIDSPMLQVLSWLGITMIGGVTRVVSAPHIMLLLGGCHRGKFLFLSILAQFIRVYFLPKN